MQTTENRTDEIKAGDVLVRDRVSGLHYPTTYPTYYIVIHINSIDVHLEAWPSREALFMSEEFLQRCFKDRTILARFHRASKEDTMRVLQQYHDDLKSQIENKKAWLNEVAGVMRANAGSR